MQARHTEWRASGWSEEARSEAFEPTGLAGAQRTALVVLECLGLFPYSALPHQQCCLSARAQRLVATIGLLPQPVGQQLGFVARPAQQLAQTFGASRCLLRPEQIGATFREQSSGGALAPEQDATSVARKVVRRGGTSCCSSVGRIGESQEAS